MDLVYIYIYIYLYICVFGVSVYILYVCMLKRMCVFECILVNSRKTCTYLFMLIVQYCESVVVCVYIYIYLYKMYEQSSNQIEYFNKKWSDVLNSCKFGK